MNNNTGYFQLTEPADPSMRPINDSFGRVSYVELHESTSPERIRQIHETDVWHAVQVLDTLDVDVLSDWTILPRFNVQRALFALGLSDFNPVKKAKVRVGKSNWSRQGMKPLAAPDAKA